MLRDQGVLDHLLFTFPLWLVGLLIIAACLMARELGAFVYRRRKARQTADADPTDNDAQSYIIGAIFGLLAFIVGLTFSIALDRYDTRRGLVAEEANAINTAYLRASLFDEPHSTLVQETLRQYAHSRIAPSGLWNEDTEARLSQTLALRDQLWQQSYAAILPIRDTDQASYSVEAVNEIINVGTRRELAGRAHVPTRILDVMLLYLLASSGVLGFLLRGNKGGQRHATAVLIVLFTVVITLILDLDRPQAGTVRVPQRALEELAARLDRDRARAVPALPAAAPPER